MTTDTHVHGGNGVSAASGAVAPQDRHTKRRRCPICDGAEGDPRGQGKRCIGFTMNGWARCSRPELAGQLDPDSVGLYHHKLAGACHCGTTHGTGFTAIDNIEATYDYRDERGTLLFQVVRKPGKRFLQRKPDGAGGWIWKLGDTPRVPYRLPELLAADRDAPVYIVEGEKDVETARELGMIATCNPGGAGKWRAIEGPVAAALRGRTIVVVADRDDAGRKHAADVASRLSGVAAALRVVEPPPPHKDLTDWIQGGGTVEDVLSRAPVEWEQDDVEPPPSLPTIAVTTSLERDANLAIEALTHDPKLYQRSGALVHVTQSSEEECENERSPIAVDSPVIHTMAFPTLLERLSSWANWTKPDARVKEGARQVLPPPQIAACVLARKEWRDIRTLVGVITTPTMRPDGTIVQTPGYDPATGYLYAPNDVFPPVDDAPTQEQARAALAELAHLYVDFPFVDEAARMVPIAALLTLVVRPAILGPVPCFAFDSSKRGTGKGLAAAVLAEIATGRPPPLTTFPAARNGQDELEKMLGAYALAGTAVLFFDNVPVGCTFGGAPLEKAITGTDVSFRILGASEAPTIAWRAVVLVAGNNLTIGAETARRVLVGRMVSPLERPEERTNWAIPKLVEYARANRPRLVVAALTILRAYTHALGNGAPPVESPLLGSFEAWSTLVPRAIMFAGGADVHGTRVTLTGGGDEEEEAHAAILEHLPMLVGENGMTAAAILEALYPAQAPLEKDGHDRLRELVVEVTNTKPGARPTATKLGCYFRRVRDSNVGGATLVALGANRDKVILWGVR